MNGNRTKDGKELRKSHTWKAAVQRLRSWITSLPAPHTFHLFWQVIRYFSSCFVESWEEFAT